MQFGITNENKMTIELSEIKKQSTSTPSDGNIPEKQSLKRHVNEMTNGKHSMANGKENGTEENEAESPLPGTLLEKYVLFQRRCPRKFAKMIEAQKIREEEAVNIYRPNVLIDALHDKLERQAGREDKQYKVKKNLPPTLHLKFQYFKNLKQDEDEDSLSNKFRDLIDDDDDYVSTFEYQDEESRGFSLFGKSKEEKLREKLRNKQELRIMALGAENLYKWTGDERIKKSRISCFLHPDCDSYGSEMESEYDDPDYNHVTRWNHVFIYRGFSIEMLRGKIIELAVDTRTTEDKIRIGLIKLAVPTSDFGIIDVSQSQHCSDDPKLWEKFLNDPETLEVHVPLFPTEHVKRIAPRAFTLSTPPFSKKIRRSKHAKAK